jgi:hypothetical protein
MTEPFRSRARAQLKLILTFRGTVPPPPNIPMRLYILGDQMSSAIRSWLLGFTFHHQHIFPPFHKVRAPFVAIKGPTLAQICFNFRKYLQWWHPDHHPRCTCAAFPMSIQMKKRSTEHISCFASDISDVPLFAAHMEDELCPSQSSFLAHNTQAFEKFLHQSKLPSSLMQYWQYFLTQEWHRFQTAVTLSEKWNFLMFDAN